MHPPPDFSPVTLMPPTIPAPTEDDRIALARRLFHDYYTMCFWHLRPDLEITADTLPAIIHGLRTNGNRQAFIDSAQLAEGK